MNAATRARHRAAYLEMGAMIEDRLAASGSTIAQLARAIGRPYSTVHGKVRRGRRMTTADVALFATALGCEPGDLLPTRS